MSFFAGFLKIIAQGGWGFSTSFLPQESEFRTFFVPRGSGIFPFEKISRELAWGNGQA